ncbi:MAG: imidazole glycerol phosphate synthase subunit HisF [Spirochaetaceae bacterium]|nr:imidazole glycerol phosphate synthase subunit HisF [Spirochaetaceae bacterium]|tara:strand:+ start:29152 stop:29919 length:768 start_codon:yes stop_codon:yes gene_type:complete
MRNVRLIARLDIKGPNLIKSVQLEGLRVIGNPEEFAHEYYNQGADELLFIDTVASLYGRNNLTSLIKDTVRDVFVPLTVGGGIRTIQDVEDILRSGADKVAINTAAVSRPELISEVARKYGSQCMVLSVQARRNPQGIWEAFTDNGRERTGMSVQEVVQRGVDLGAGEILLTSIDREGTRKGFDIELIRAVTDMVSVPVIASGGMGTPDHFVEVVTQARPDAVAMADILHYKRATIGDVREIGLQSQIPLRSYHG